MDYCASQPCKNAGTCTTKSDTFECRCLPGFRGEMCTDDVNECTAQSGLCQNGGTCENLHGSYRLDKLSYEYQTIIKVFHNHKINVNY